MTLAEYFHADFRQDLQAVVEGLPELHPHGIDNAILQPRTISSSNPVVRRWSRNKQGLFASALFITVLADQVCYAHFKEYYPAFRYLTQYPKWRGDCPGACNTHIHPILVFPLIGQREGTIATVARVEFQGTVQQPEYGALPDDLFETLKREIVGFFPTHLPSVDTAAFWERCDAEVLTPFRLLYLASRRQAI